MIFRETFSQKLSFFLIHQIPCLMGVFLLFVGLFPLRLSFFTQHYIPFVYISLFYWIVFRPDLLSPLRVFFLGFLADLIYQTPLGYQSFCFVLFYVLVLIKQRFLQARSFSFLWRAFCIYSLGFILFQWLFSMLLYWQYLSVTIFLAQMILLWISYPFVAGICGFFYVKWLEDEE